MDRISQTEKYQVQLGMKTLGGGFVETLGMLLTHADPTNTKKIKKAFPEYWEKYLALGKELHVKEIERDEFLNVKLKDLVLMWLKN